jgi:hypothetical protein
MMRKAYFCEYCGGEYSTEAACLEHESKCYKSPVFLDITVYEYSLRFDIYRGEYDSSVGYRALQARYDKERDEFVLTSTVIPSYVTMYRPSVYATCGGYYTAKMYTPRPAMEAAEEQLIEFANNYAKDCARRVVDRGLIKTNSVSL